MNNTQTVAFLCQCLAFRDTDLTGTAEETINSDRADWHKVLRCAGQHNVAPALYSALNSTGLLHRLPDDCAEYLHAVWSLTRQRNRMLRQALVTACSHLNLIGITPLLLKGAAGLVPKGEYPGSSDRIMADLDLLVPVDRLENAQNTLQQAGYAPMYHGRRAEYIRKNNIMHDIPLRAADAPVRIELHRHVSKTGTISLDSVWRRAATVQLQEAAIIVLPDPTFRVLHNFVHHQFDHNGFARNLLDLRRLYEFVLLCRTWDQEIRYAELSSLCEEKRISAAWQAYQLSAQRLFGLPLKNPVSSYARYKDAQVRLYTHFSKLHWWEHWFGRACRLPKRLVTPSWYPLKYRQLTSTGEFAKDADK